MNLIFHLMTFLSGMSVSVPIAMMSIDSDEDREFMITLYLYYSRRLVRYAERFTLNRSDAEDAVQNAFLSLIPRTEQLRSMQRDYLEGYVFVTVKNAAFMMNREIQRELSAEKNMAGSITMEEDMFSDTTAEELMEALGRLSEKDQLLLRMKYFSRQTDREIALQTGCRESSVRKMIARSRIRLAAEMRKEGREHD